MIDYIRLSLNDQQASSVAENFSMHKDHPRKKSLIYDRPATFGWISIALHWVTAGLIIALWVIGKNIGFAGDGETAASWHDLHVTLGLTTWVLLAGRIVWRMMSGHPHAHGLTAKTHAIAKFAHYLMLAALTLLIISGPTIAWLGRGSSPGAIAHTIHVYAGNLLLILVLTHVVAGIKHLMFHDDESVVRMLWPKS